MHLVNPKGLSFTHIFTYTNLWQHIKKVMAHSCAQGLCSCMDMLQSVSSSLLG